MTEYLFNAQNGEVVDAANTGQLPIGEGNPPLIPLRVLLQAPAGDFPYKNGDFSTPPAGEWRWPRERLLDLGKLTLDVLQEEVVSDDRVQLGPELTKKHLDRMHILRLGPSVTVVEREFDTIWGFREALGIPPGVARGKYDDWSLQDYREYAANVAKRLGKKPNLDDYSRMYKAGLGPGVGLLKERTGGIRALNAFAGYPNIYDWSLDDYTFWGTQVVNLNSGILPSERMMMVLAREKRGPSPNSTRPHFGGSLRTFQDSVQEEWHIQQAVAAAARGKGLRTFALLRQQEQLPGELDSAAEGEKISAAAKYALARACLPRRSLEICTELARAP
jgi:hypothetical protein